LASVLVHPISPNFKSFVYGYDLFVCAILWIEFIYSYLHADDRRQYLRSNSLSILGMLPIDFVFLRALRLIKLFQFIKLYVLARETTGRFSRFLKHTYLDKIGLIAILFIFIITILVSIFDSNINDIQTALWYVVVSVTSTGYGDVVPVTISGKIIGIVAMVGGILIFATVTAVISSLYVSKISRDQHSDLESKIDDLASEIERLNEKIDELKKQ
jgi:voltage-gated potassium channel